MDFLYRLKELFVYDASSPMLFSSGTFVLIFSVFIIFYGLLHKNKTFISLYVIAFSVFFYYKSSGWYLAILVFTAISDYAFALAIAKTRKKYLRKIWLTLSLGTSLGLLAYFKYTNFFLENITAFLQGGYEPLDIFLPIGISFYTFQSVSYVLDVYWGKLKPTRKFLDYAFFLSFFPQLVAGPIVKAHFFLPQLEKKINITREMVWGGMWLIMIGLFKKAVIADYISQYNDMLFAAPENYSGFENLMGVLGYTLQIYCDFSGYSDMAIGLGKVMGFDLGINFRFPYQALNITDFWRRWHISLSSWLRDYVYIPLGGNKKGKTRMYINLATTMLVGGLWHGANWKFVFWGAMHGTGLAMHKAFKKISDKINNNFFVRFVSWSFTFIFVVFLWIFFRAADTPTTAYTERIPVQNEQSFQYRVTQSDTSANKIATIELYQSGKFIKKYSEEVQNSDGRKIIFDLTEKEGFHEIKVITIKKGFDVAVSIVRKIAFDMDLSFAIHFWEARKAWVLLIIIGFLMHSISEKWNQRLIEAYIRSHYTIKVLMFVILLQLVVQFKLEDVHPFIYFQF